MSSDDSVTNELEIFMHLNEEKPIVQVETSNDNSIQAFGTSFHYAKARDFEVIVDAEGRINYTKLLAQITGDRQKLKHLCEDNSSVLDVIRSYNEDKLLAWKEKTKDIPSGGNPPDGNTHENSLRTMSVSQLTNAGIFHNVLGGASKFSFLRGTYGPRYLLDIFIILTRPSYYKLIHELLETIDEGSQLKNRSFDDELRRTIAQKEEENEQLKTKIKQTHRNNDRSFKRLNKRNHDLQGMLRDIKKQNDELLRLNHNQTHELHEANNRLQDVQHHVHDIHERITGHMEELNRSARFINEHFHSNNTTFAAINECITIFPSQDLINNWPNELQANEIIYDVFAGNNSRAYQRSSMFKPNRAYHITNEEFEDGLRLHSIPCADGKDLLKYVRTHMPRHLGYFHPDSKLITSDLERVKEYIRGSVDIMLQRNKQTVVHSLDEIRNAITHEFEERFGQLEEHIHDEIHDVIEPIHDEINEIISIQKQNHNEELQAIHDMHEEQVQMHSEIEVIQNQIQKHANHMEERIDQLNQQIQQLTMREQLLNTYPGIQTEYLEGYINKRYRTFRIDDERKIWYQPYAGARDIELTLDQLQNIILRDRAGHKYRNGQML